MTTEQIERLKVWQREIYTAWKRAKGLAEALRRQDEGLKALFSPNKRVILSIVKIDKYAYNYLSQAKLRADYEGESKEGIV